MKPRFICFDGEGDNLGTLVKSYGKERRRVTNQIYTLMGASTGDVLTVERGGKRARLETDTCLSWICSVAEQNRDATFVIFAGSYDFNMILRELPWYKLKQLYKEKVVTYKGVVTDQPSFGVFHDCYFLSWTQRKSLTITRYKHTRRKNGYVDIEKDKRGKNIVDLTFTIWDVFGFFQSSLVNAVRSYFKDDELDPDELAFVQAMKKKRGDELSQETTEQVARYCVLECRLTVRLMDRLAGYLDHPDIQLELTRWSGAGSIASAGLKKYHVQDHLIQPPPAVHDASLHAYFGGRIELIRYGHFTGDGVDYDERSAYPDAMTYLDSLRGGTWENVRRLYTFQSDQDGNVVSTLDTYPSDNPSMSGFPQLGNLTMCRVDWTLWDKDRRIYPFPYRDDEGLISYPAKGYGWYHLPEVLAALRHLGKYKNGEIRILEYWTFRPDPDQEKPFWFIPMIYELRAKLKAAGDGAEKALKLWLNSTYGKLAQRIGLELKTDKEGQLYVKLPPFNNMVYAGNITSRTRANLFNLAMVDDSAVIMFATDGLFTGRPLPGIQSGVQLGDWDVSTFTEIIAVQSGVYYLRTGPGEPWQAKTRGFVRPDETDPDTLTPDKIIDAWASGKKEVYGKTKKFITLGMVINATLPDTIKNAHWRHCTWEEFSRKQSLTPTLTKRDNPLNDRVTKKRNPARMLLATYPQPNKTPDDMSRKHAFLSLPQEMKLLLEREEESMEIEMEE